jgi:alpha-galactosidase
VEDPDDLRDQLIDLTQRSLKHFSVLYCTCEGQDTSQYSCSCQGRSAARTERIIVLSIRIESPSIQRSRLKMTASGPVEVDNFKYTLPASSSSLSVSGLTFDAGDQNTLSVISPRPPLSLSITNPPPIFYPSTDFTVVGDATRVQCYTGLCVPVGWKIGDLSPGGSATISITAPTSYTGTKFVEMYFCNNDIALSTSWTTGTNTRNMTITVNNVTTRIEVPLSGRSSELFSPGLGWEDTGTFGVLLDGWVEGSNNIVVGNIYGDQGLVSWGADFVGLSVQW